MAYRITIGRRADRALQRIDSRLRARIVEKIVMLGCDPDDRRLDVRGLRGMSSGVRFFRLRVGKWRVIFGRDDEIRIITIERIDPRGDAYR